MYRKVLDNKGNLMKDRVYRPSDFRWIPTLCTDNSDCMDFNKWCKENNKTLDDLDIKKD